MAIASAGASVDGTADERDGSFTSHLSVVDEEGNAVSATTTVGVLFGSGIHTGGFFLNSSANNLDDRTRGTDRGASHPDEPVASRGGSGTRLHLGRV